METGNKRNGHSPKNLKSQYGEFQIDVPRDRNGEFEPKLIPKYQRDIAGIEEKVISLYARGMSTRDIHDQLQDLYGIELSAEMVSKITDKILPQVKEWQSRPLNPVYPFVFMDCIHYKVRGRLLEERRNGASVCYAYDAAGNRIRKTDAEGEICYRYNEKNQLLCEETSSGKNWFTYDKQGGIVEEKKPSGVRRYAYNSRHQQVRVETEDGSVQENRYDVEGLRYELLENGKRIRFVYHQGELLHEKGEDETQTSYHLGAGIEAFQRDQQILYYHRDEQLSTAFITGSAGSVRNSYQYDAFGTELEKAEQLPNRIRYTGQQYDSLMEQYYLRARYYNPMLGRFMQEDVYQGDGLNLYAYCGNNPVVYYDPSGYTGALSTSTSECGTDAKTDEGQGGTAEEGGNQTNHTLLSSEEWYRYFQETYGADNVTWNVSSFEDMVAHPTSLRGYSADEIGQILGEGWTRDTYGSNGSGWKFIENDHRDNMVFYHGGGGTHEGAYWGISSGPTGKVQVVDTNTYVPRPNDMATIIYSEDW